MKKRMTDQSWAMELGRTLRFALPCFLFSMFLLPADALVLGQTDPLGNPIRKTKDPAKQKADTPKSTGDGNESQSEAKPEKQKSGLPTLPDSMLKQTGKLKDFQPGVLQKQSLPKVRDFESEGHSSARSQQDVPPTMRQESGRALQEGQPQRGMRQANAQSDSAEPPIAMLAAEGPVDTAPHGHFQLISRSTQRWEFGLEIKSAGNLVGAVASAPVPIEWDEQKIKIVRTYKSPNVGSVRMKEFPGQGQQMIVSVPRMRAGETATAFITMDIERFDIVEPQNTELLQLPEKGNRAARLYLGESPYIETRHKRIRELADSIVKPEDSPWKQALSIYDWVQQNIVYEFDPQIHSCIEALDAKQGDCEEVASLFIALCRAKGIPARAVWCNDHTYPEFMLCTPEGKDVWFPCQITTTEHMFGVMYDDRPILQKGDKFKILGESAPFRYLKSAMIAKSATASPTFRWIIRKVDSSSEARPADSPLGNSPLGN